MKKRLKMASNLIKRHFKKHRGHKKLQRSLSASNLMIVPTTEEMTASPAASASTTNREILKLKPRVSQNVYAKS